MALPSERWIVHKFGSSSKADASCFPRVAGILERAPEPLIALVTGLGAKL